MTMQLGKEYPISQKESQRIQMLKCISILMVVLIHATDADFLDDSTLASVMTFEKFNSFVFARCSIGMFFLISGVLLFKRVRPYLGLLRDRLRTLGIPYFIWNTLWIAFFVVIGFVPAVKAAFSDGFTPILERNFLQWLELYGIGPEDPQAYPFWFIRDLFLAVLLSPLIWKLADRLPRLTAGLGIAGALMLPMSLHFGASIPYFLMAAAIVRLEVHMAQIDRVPVWAMLGVHVLSMIPAQLLGWTILRNLCYLLGILTWIRLTALITGKLEQGLLWLSQSAFMIFAAHEYTLTCMKKVFFMVAPVSQATVLAQYLLLPLIVIALCVLADWILRRWLPRFHGVITGGR